MSNTIYQGSALNPTLFEPANVQVNPRFVGAIYPDTITPEPPSNALNVNCESYFPLGWVLLTIILLFIICLILFLYFEQRQNLINPNNCPQIKGNYGVLPGVIGDAVRSCGNQSNEPCEFQADSLEDAINICDLRSDICSTFSYDPGSGQMQILAANAPLTAANRIDVYIRQTGLSTGN